MDPLNAPLPTACNLPFQPDAGNQTSILISDSLVGFSVAAIRQNEGKALIASAFSWTGDVNAPASTLSASVMVAPGSLSFDNAPHDPAAPRGERATAAATANDPSAPTTTRTAVACRSGARIQWTTTGASAPRLAGRLSIRTIHLNAFSAAS